MVGINSAPSMEISGVEYRYYLYLSVLNSYYYYIFNTKRLRYMKNPRDLSTYSELVCDVRQWKYIKNRTALSDQHPVLHLITDDLKRDFVVRMIHEV